MMHGGHWFLLEIAPRLTLIKLKSLERFNTHCETLRFGKINTYSNKIVILVSVVCIGWRRGLQRSGAGFVGDCSGWNAHHAGGRHPHGRYCSSSGSTFFHLWGVYTIQQTSSKLPSNVFKIHVLMLEVRWTFAGSCKHPSSRWHTSWQAGWKTAPISATREMQILLPRGFKLLMSSQHWQCHIGGVLVQRNACKKVRTNIVNAINARKKPSCR